LRSLAELYDTPIAAARAAGIEADAELRPSGTGPDKILRSDNGDYSKPLFRSSSSRFVLYFFFNWF
jgi:hypothetical protein